MGGNWTGKSFQFPQKLLLLKRRREGRIRFSKLAIRLMTSIKKYPEWWQNKLPPLASHGHFYCNWSFLKINFKRYYLYPVHFPLPMSPPALVSSFWTRYRAYPTSSTDCAPAETFRKFSFNLFSGIPIHCPCTKSSVKSAKSSDLIVTSRAR